MSISTTPSSGPDFHPHSVTSDPSAGLATTSWWRHHADNLIALAVFAATCVFTILMAPPGRAPEAAYIFAAPAIFWAYRRPSWKRYLLATLGSQAVAWTVILGWLHHVTWLGLFLLGPVIGLWIGSWFAAVRWIMPRMPGRPTLTRLLAMFGLAAAWVLIEWTRTWLLSGFPWLPLAATQWQRISILQVAAYTGAAGVSFVLIVVNIGTAAYAHRLLCESARGLARRSQEFLAALFLLLVCLAVFVPEAINRGQYALPLGQFSIVQPAIAQTLKWDPESAPGIEQTLVDQTLAAVRATPRPDLIIWPEAATPWAALGDARTQGWIELLARQTGVPLVLGSIVIEKPNTPEERWFNGALAVDPASGVQSSFYAKRKLVPFGEYMPFRPILGWIDKFVPIGGDFNRGASAAPLSVSIAGRDLRIGPLICYEDIFPKLARANVRAGADLLMVHTNNGWFGEGDAAYQHAANAVLRAVEMRRPVLRSGNSGWSGWIDEFGTIRAVLTQTPDGRVHTEPGPGQGTVYFRGHAAFPVAIDSRWLGRLSPYARWGDWFVLFSSVIVLWTWTRLRHPPSGAGQSPTRFSLRRANKAR